MKIALDLEGPCANAHQATVDRDEDIEWPWFDEWKGMDDEQFQKYMHVSSNLWHNHYEEVPLAEDGVALFVDELRQQNVVEILTARTGVDDQIKSWLDLHDIEVDGFHSTRMPKAEFQRSTRNPDGFDAFIDDNPRMVGEVDTLLLYDRPWNQSVDVDGVNTVRIESLADAVEHLEDGMLVYG